MAADDPALRLRPAAIAAWAVALAAGPAGAQPQAAVNGDAQAGAAWALGALLTMVALAILWWRHARRDRTPPELQRRRRSDRMRPSRYESTQLDTQVDTQLDTVLDPRGGKEPLRRIGPYVVEHDIGRGAMGMVLQCRDMRSGEAVALKTMALGREFHGEALTEARERFFREAEMAGRLQHNDIVAVRDAGEDAGIAYIGMELLHGRDLSEYAQPLRLLPVPTVLGIAMRVARALAYAHRQGVTHRDIKPANIMVELKSGMVKVTDFGIARIIDSTATRTGLVLGTPSFMSPEQMAGARTDGRSDLYALGVTLFQLLTGSLPHRSDSMAELIRSIGNDVAPDIRSLRPELPPALADVVALALEKRPEMRYANGDAMAADLQAVLAALKPLSDSAAAAAKPQSPRSAGGGRAEAGHNPAP